MWGLTLLIRASPIAILSLGVSVHLDAAADCLQVVARVICVYAAYNHDCTCRERGPVTAPLAGEQNVPATALHGS